MKNISVVCESVCDDEICCCFVSICLFIVLCRYVA